MARRFRIGFIALYLVFTVASLSLGFTRTIALGVALALAALSGSFLVLWVAIRIRRLRNRPIQIVPSSNA